MAETKRVRRKCCECGTRSADVLERGPVWDAGGVRIGHFEWAKDDSPLLLCEACEEEMDEYRSCDECGAKVCAEWWGAGYLPDDYDGEPLCPDCAPKQD